MEANNQEPDLREIIPRIHLKPIVVPKRLRPPNTKDGIPAFETDLDAVREVESIFKKHTKKNKTKHENLQEK